MIQLWLLIWFEHNGKVVHGILYVFTYFFLLPAIFIAVKIFFFRQSIMQLKLAIMVSGRFDIAEFYKSVWIDLVRRHCNIYSIDFPIDNTLLFISFNTYLFWRQEEQLVLYTLQHAEPDTLSAISSPSHRLVPSPPLRPSHQFSPTDINVL